MMEIEAAFANVRRFFRIFEENRRYLVNPWDGFGAEWNETVWMLMERLYYNGKRFHFSVKPE